ncbi:hypothetical protein AXG93_2727s1240 [Marchantia polymorpha subsp. ruderalis]|uniref:Uncharacterized protein n=1 Tax=Marchantia polymorpha subsp. ruderalis TaxID=1480154 RepID=A0A176VBS3_MARPO|nr:hypothetical protein AXG93_2727s1240 [Marchantia polymorpha subsp. ruderalis]
MAMSESEKAFWQCNRDSEFRKHVEEAAKLEPECPDGDPSPCSVLCAALRIAGSDFRSAVLSAPAVDSHAALRPSRRPFLKPVGIRGRTLYLSDAHSPFCRLAHFRRCREPGQKNLHLQRRLVDTSLVAALLPLNEPRHAEARPATSHETAALAAEAEAIGRASIQKNDRTKHESTTKAAHCSFRELLVKEREEGSTLDWEKRVAGLWSKIKVIKVLETSKDTKVKFEATLAIQTLVSNPEGAKETAHFGSHLKSILQQIKKSAWAAQDKLGTIFPV